VRPPPYPVAINGGSFNMRPFRAISVIIILIFSSNTLCQSSNTGPSLEETTEFMENMVNANKEIVIEEEGYGGIKYKTYLILALQVDGPELRYTIERRTSVGKLKFIYTVNAPDVVADSIELTNTPVGGNRLMLVDFRGPTVSFECKGTCVSIKKTGATYQHFSFVFKEKESALRFSKAFRHWLGFYQNSEPPAPKPSPDLFR
jgi:hypothetical protein